MDEVPVQFYQSVIGIELAVTGALLFQIRYFAPRQDAAAEGRDLPDPRLRLLVAAVIVATVFGSLDAIWHREGTVAATAVTIGLAASMLPILARVLPPLVREAHDDQPREYSTVTITGLVLYVVAVVSIVLLLNN
jgi:hypothetical protein